MEISEKMSVREEKESRLSVRPVSTGVPTITDYIVLHAILKARRSTGLSPWSCGHMCIATCGCILASMLVYVWAQKAKKQYLTFT